MSKTNLISWNVTGELSEIIHSQGYKNNKFLQVIVAVEGGFCCAYVRDHELIKQFENLEIGSKLSITGAIDATKLPSTKPVFLNASFVVTT